ncbi:RING-H2 finger protein ATL57-like [Carica papaya]|uniref:RING-H2 finger protein ATL57-like n=1 Tax=Carica papaya TaxID=3649 RepID=UPI000B8CC018|nr:RING-H2 finger protein ATL57-like [Carica papaya]
MVSPSPQPRSPPPPAPTASHQLPLSPAIFPLCYLVFSVIFIIYVTCRRYNEPSDIEVGNLASQLHRRVLPQLPSLPPAGPPGSTVFVYGKNAVNCNEVDCAICLDGFSDGDECKVLHGCNHGFHKACIDKWLSQDKHCPLCRGAVLEGSVRVGAIHVEPRYNNDRDRI